MALNLTDLFTVIGKYVYAVNSVNGQFAELETIKDQIFDALEDEGLEEHYTELPAQIQTMQTSVTSWIATFISEIESVLTDEEYILENLPIFETTVTAVLNAIFDQMTTEGATIKSSITEIDTVDQDEAFFTVSGDLGSINVYVTRILDGVNDPSDLVSAHTSYTNVESQLAKSATIYAKVLSASAGAETLQLFASAPEEDSYTGDVESPGIGPTITNIAASNVLATNDDFTSFSGDNPTGWTLAGGVAGTDWEDVSGTEDGPLQINTVGVTVKQQLTGLTQRQMYFFAVRCSTVGGIATSTVKLRVENVDGLTIHKNITTNANVGNGNSYVYGFYAIDADINPEDIYFCIEYDATTDAATNLQIDYSIVSPVTYFNGIGFVAWNPLTTATDIPNINDYNSIVIDNGNEGVFQTFFRKAFNIQLPTADSPTILDSLADF